MIITRLLKYFKVDLSGESVVAPAIDIDRILLKLAPAHMHHPLMFSLHHILYLILLLHL